MSGIPTKEQAARQIWLLYFNRKLLEQGIITEKEHNRMKIKIQSQRPALSPPDPSPRSEGPSASAQIEA